ncbi:hypothetical protein RAS2_00530 [Phycisphaerae bacterium RAS2]|nr:hypothetical protein RAS2_00530 [Phycisphaerae bacterium RAS2]
MAALPEGWRFIYETTRQLSSQYAKRDHIRRMIKERGEKLSELSPSQIALFTEFFGADYRPEILDILTHVGNKAVHE